MGEDYNSSADEGGRSSKLAEAEPEGDPTDPSSLLYKFNEYKKQLKQYEQDNKNSDDEVEELPIKTKINS